LAWFVAALGLSITLVLPNDLALLQASWLVPIVAFAVSVFGYVALAPAPAGPLPVSGPAEGPVAPVQAAPPQPVPPPPPVEHLATFSVAEEESAPPPPAPPPPGEDLPTFSVADEEPAPDVQEQADDGEISFDRDE
jgi:hypothetical protein